MRILIATGIFPPDIGGPAKYAAELATEFSRRGHAVRVVSFSALKWLPPGIRHGVYFLKVLSAVRSYDFVLALDTFSVGFPALCAARLSGAKLIVRVGGDFLWESWTERTGAKMTLKEFYARIPSLSFKEWCIFWAMRLLMRRADALAFNTLWQKDLFVKAHRIPEGRAFVVENFYPAKEKAEKTRLPKKVFLWVGRPVKWKNVDALMSAFKKAVQTRADIALEVVSNATPDEVRQKLKECWAVVLPSLTEVGSNVILEALAFDKPFIISRETGLRDRLKEVGLFADPKSEEDIAEKMRFLADEKNHAEYVRRASQFRFTHSWEEIADEFLAIYGKL